MLSFLFNFVIFKKFIIDHSIIHIIKINNLFFKLLIAFFEIEKIHFNLQLTSLTYTSLSILQFIGVEMQYLLAS